ncbi:MAG: hypothetical protein C0501_06640 [Isosphaera sp.]|nr:hypothetical protein [Isosphaera sp.]
MPKPWCDLVGLTLMTLLRVHLALSGRADTFLRLARPALTFASAKAPDTELPVGASKFGGCPDLPTEEWPVYRGIPLDFLAQFDLAVLSASVACRELPSSGVLSVFYWAEGNVYDSSDEGGWRVLHFPDPAELARRHPPPNMSGCQFSPCRLAFTETLTLPKPDTPWADELAFAGGVEVCRQLAEEHGLGHRVLGYAHHL